jgi:putative flavoprotein involved in K+ transport
VVPPFASRLSPEVVQLTAATYRNPGQLGGATRILVAGDGATGRQIALELASGHDVWLATGRARVVTAQRILGRDQLWGSALLTGVGRDAAYVAGVIAERLTTSAGARRDTASS